MKRVVWIYLNIWKIVWTYDLNIKVPAWKHAFKIFNVNEPEFEEIILKVPEYKESSVSTPEY